MGLIFIIIKPKGFIRPPTSSSVITISEDSIEKKLLKKSVDSKSSEGIDIKIDFNFEEKTKSDLFTK